MHTLKAEARRLFTEALHQVDVRAAMARNVLIEGDRLVAAGASFDLDKLSGIVIIAIGKGATPMYEATAEILQSAPWPQDRLSAIVVSPHQPKMHYGRLTFFTGAHPVPDESSRYAATAILRALHAVTAENLVLFLVSGGSSAMVEMPLDPTISTDDFASFNRALVGSGLSIGEMNILRKHLSATKAGRLAVAAAPAAQCTFVLSDVPAGALDTVGSGPSLPDSSLRTQSDDLYRRLRAAHRLPARIEHFFESNSYETPKRTHPAFAKAAWTCVLSSDDLAAGAVNAARAAGFHVEVDNHCDEWPCIDAAAYLLDRSASLKQQYSRTCLISVGEVGVTLPQASGRGGRNQHFVLQCALRLGGGGGYNAVLSAGSDGIDGNSPAAGAVADGDTCHQALLRGVDPVEILKQFDSFMLFDALSDTITTGPTGNNLRDLRLLLTR